MRTKYRFVNDAGVETIREWHEDEFHANVKNGKLKVPSRMGGKPTVWRLVSNAPCPMTTGNYAACWPCKIDSMAVATSQIAEAMAEDARIGVPTRYDTTTGQPILESPAHYRRYAEAHGYYKMGEKGGGYRDPQRLSVREREIRAMAGRAVRKCDD